jgi:hypothetical protein
MDSKQSFEHCYSLIEQLTEPLSEDSHIFIDKVGSVEIAFLYYEDKS